MKETPQRPEVRELLKGSLEASSNWLKDCIELFLLDSRLAGVSIIRILIYGIVIALLLVSGWLLLLFTIGLFLSEWLPLTAVLPILALLCVVVCGLLLYRISLLAKNINFKTTRQQFVKGSNTSGITEDYTNATATSLSG